MNHVRKIHRWWSSSLRNQVLTLIATLMILGTCALLLMTWAATELAADAFINQRLEQQVEHLTRQAGTQEQLLTTNTAHLAVFAQGDPQKPHFLDAIHALGQQEFERDDAHVLTVQSPFTEQWLHWVYYPEKDTMLAPYGQEVTTYVLYMATILLGFGLTSALWFANRITRPVSQLNQQVTAAQPGQRLDIPSRPDELGQLGQSFQGTLDRLSDFIARERQFSRFASHELRTPVNVIQGATELLRLTAQSDKQQAVIARIERAHRDMNSLVQTFLELSRENSTQHAQPSVTLSELLRQVIHEHQPMIASQLRVNLDVQGSMAQQHQVPEFAAKVVLSNLIRNAFSYSHNFVDIQLSGCRLVMVNDIHPEACSGFGLGSDILTKVCHKQGWQYHSKSTVRRFYIVIYFHSQPGHVRSQHS